MPTEEQLLEIHRLAVLGAEVDITLEVTSALANSWLGLSRFREVRELCLKTLELGQDPDTLVSLARARWVLGEVAEAMRLCHDALKMYEAVGDRAGQARTLNNIGLVYDNTGRRDKALEYHQQALPIWRRWETELVRPEPLTTSAGSTTILGSGSRPWSTISKPCPSG